MNSTSMRLRAAARAALLCGVTALASGCASWHVTEQTPYEAFSEGVPPKVRVTLEDGTQTVLTRPRILGEVLAGLDDTCLAQFGRMSSQCPEIGFAVFDISVFEVEKRNALAIVLPAVAGLSAAWLLANR